MDEPLTLGDWLWLEVWIPLIIAVASIVLLYVGLALGGLSDVYSMWLVRRERRRWEDVTSELEDEEDGEHQ